ncbi:unnamed protein product, partial [Didymodactylos carnosus]
VLDMQQRQNQQNGNQNSPVSRQAEITAETRYPFSPYILHFKKDVKDKHIISELIKYVRDTLGHELEIAGYRKTTINCQNRECDILLFVGAIMSFEVLFGQENWPPQIINEQYDLKIPSTPPQLS